MRIIIPVFIFVVCIFIGYFMLKPQNPADKLPIISPNDVAQEMVDSTLLGVGIGHKIGAFEFLNQDNQTISLQDVKGKVFVAEYFFTTCGTICPRMNAEMQKVQKAYYNNPLVKILSFTVDPEVDSVPQLKQYANAHNALSTQWYFLTGDKQKLYTLARTSFFVLKPAEAQNLGDAGNDFIHTNNFVLVDQQLRIRGYYDGTDAKHVEKLIHDISILLAEK